MRLILSIAVLLLLLLNPACRSGGNSKTDSLTPETGSSVPVEMSKSGGQVQSSTAEELIVPGKKIIKNGDITFEISDIRETRTSVDGIIIKHKAYISQENEYSYPGRIEQRLQIRVPAENFDLLVAEITRDVERFDNKSITINDVSEEFVDLEARLRTKKELEERYRQILGKANSIQEILSVEAQIGSIRAEIESFEGRLKYLESQVGYSTLNLCYYEKVSNPPGFSSRFGKAFINGWHNLVRFFIGLLNIWPFILLPVIILIIWRRYFRKPRKKRKDQLI